MTHHIVQNADEAPDGRRIAQAALRNTGPLLDALKLRLPSQGRVLEVASGTGQHAAAFARTFPALTWMPSDVDPGQRESIAAWQRQSALTNLSAPIAIDVGAPWPALASDVHAVLTINLFHLVPDPLVSRFFHETRHALTKAGRVIVYGPFLRGASYASDGDRQFDASLRDRDPAIGYKSLEAISDVARATGFAPIAVDEMPANNLLLSFEAT